MVGARSATRRAITAGLAAVLGVSLVLVFSVARPSGALHSLSQRPSGAIEGRVVLRQEPTSRTVERYVDEAGVPQEIARLPVIVRLDGTVPGVAPARSSGPLELMQKERAFSQLMLVVPVGARVTFPNGDPFFHNVFSYSRPKRFDLGRYKQGESKTVVFDEPGYVKVMCEVHKWMRTAVVAVENPFYAVVSADGRFRLNDVPPGRYRLVIEHFDRRTQTLDVTVRDGGTAEVNASL